ncbi:feruloyl-CoA synthase [Amycolatopsis thermoflava]|uniref:Trans-feruloyl-CoA synthase n=1 Tax=Amycolatopsis thermoflava TaxID=84480 RepID=A0A3N2G663_9PSEU|nr:feruloyl-CoA synthase [Amycolatopsis thermoflava]ROS32136.1 trans-feruloyl-CoA synthase [Amycolatopsis thermoflava]
MFAIPEIDREDRPDGSLVFRSRQPLAPYPESVASMLRDWADRDPGHPLIAERDADDRWRTLTYGEVRARADALGQALLDRGLGPDRPLMVLSGNSTSHFLLTMGALTAGVPLAPISVAYSLMSGDHARIKAIGELLRPGLVFAEDGARFRAAIEAVGAAAGGVVVRTGADDVPGAEPLAELERTRAGDAVESAYRALTGDSVAKILFTSGSTGAPKGVLNTHRMLCSNQQAMRQVWPFLAEERPVLADWLPWSHTFGGNHNMNMVLHNGGTLYLDDGKPAPQLFARTLRNLRDVRPTVAFNVPAGYAQLVPALEADREFAGAFFSRLRLVFNAAAALPSGLRDRLSALAHDVAGRDVPVTGSWGATETAPAVTTAHYPFTDARCIGVPIPGLEVKLAPVGEAREIRVRGDAVTPGYLHRPELSETAFDEEGYYRSGDAVALADPGDPGAGFVFQGRIAEDFKLTSGTFVRVGTVRTALLSAVPVLSDAVICGENQAFVSALAWLNEAESRSVVPGELSVRDGCVAHPRLAEHVGRLLARLNASAGSSGRVERVLLLSEPPRLDAGEITDKGYLNQRKVLELRASFVEKLYAERPHEAVIIAGG